MKINHSYKLPPSPQGPVSERIASILDITTSMQSPAQQPLSKHSMVQQLQQHRPRPRVTSPQDGPQIRPAIHPDGTIYGVFYGWRTFDGSIATADVIVVREDSWGTSAIPFNALIDPGDGQRGRRVAQNRALPFTASTAGLGQ